ncbi:MAG TPA: hypothetical protein VFP86_11530 [bacterium]|nr:hypothetical protein [bacterium]
MREAPDQVISRMLVPGEKLLWSGAPPTGIMVRSTDLSLIPFSLFICGFSAFWAFGVATSGAPVVFILFGIPCVLFGVYMLFGRFIVDAWVRANTYYGVTDQHILIASGLFGLNVESLDLDKLDDLTISERPDGRGTIIFGALPLMAGSSSNRDSSVPADVVQAAGGTVSSQLPGQPIRFSIKVRVRMPRFERIENVRLVYDTIQRAKRPA